MPKISAASMVRFANASATQKRRLVARAIADGKWPGYAPRDDYWVRMRNGLKRLIRSGVLTGPAIAAEIARFPPARRHEAAQMLQAFAGAWPPLSATAIEGTRLEVTLSHFAIRCLPHATVRIGSQRYALRFSYRHSTLISRDEKAHIELLRLALRGSGIRPAILNVRTSAIQLPRRDVGIVAFVRAEARQLSILWRAAGGPP